MSFWKKSIAGILAQKTSREWILLILIGFLGVSASLVAHGVVLERENVLIQSNFSQASERCLSFLKYNLAFESNLFCSFQHLNEHSENITRREFRDFISGMLQQNPGLQALGWVPRVSGVELTTFVEQAIKSRFAGINFRDGNPDGELGLLSKGQFYHPVYHAEPQLHSADRAGHMTKQILSFSRKPEPEKRLLNIRPIIKEGLKFLRGPIAANIEIEQHVETDIPTINGDPTQIYQILINLCAHAAHAMGSDPGILSVSLSSVELDGEFCEKHSACEPGVFVKLTVRDSGAGIAPEIADRIFEPYFTTKASGEGTGLGLSVINGIVQSHDGVITVDSEPEKDASFSIYFPAVQEKVHIQVEPEPESGFADHKKILWVDDEPDLMPMYKATFETQGFEVFGVTHPNAALEIFNETPDKFDVVITDLSMPKMNGIQLAKSINSIRPGLPIIICTGYTDFTYSTALSDIGIREVIHKPVLRDTMTKAIMRTIQKSGNHEQVENQPAESEFALQALANSFSGFVSTTAPLVRKS